MPESPSTPRPQAISAAQLQMLPATHSTVIPEDYLDAMGHMNVMWYTHLFSHGVGGVFKLVGLNREHFIANQSGTFALQAFVNYFAEVRVDEAVTVRSRVLGRSAKKIHMLHFLVKDAGDVLAATGEFVGAHIDMRVRRTSPFPAEIAANIDRLAAEHAALGWAPPTCGVLGP